MECAGLIPVGPAQSARALCRARHVCSHRYSSCVQLRLAAAIQCPCHAKFKFLQLLFAERGRRRVALREALCWPKRLLTIWVRCHFPVRSAMPLVIDNNTRSWESFDVQTASTLYWKALPVLVKQNDREEQTSELTVRILSGVNRNNHNSRVSKQLQ